MKEVSYMSWKPVLTNEGGRKISPIYKERDRCVDMDEEQNRLWQEYEVKGI